MSTQQPSIAWPTFWDGSRGGYSHLFLYHALALRTGQPGEYWVTGAIVLVCALFNWSMHDWQGGFYPLLLPLAKALSIGAHRRAGVEGESVAVVVRV